MIYTNQKLLSREKEMSFGTITGVSIGEEGRGRRLLFIPTPSGIEEVEAGQHDHLTIGETRTGFPRILNSQSGQHGVILSSQGGYTRRGNGTIHTREHDAVEVIGTANGADGDAGRIGQWRCVVALIQGDSSVCFRICRSGGNRSDILYYNGKGKFFFVKNDDIPLFLDAVGDVFSFGENRKFKKVEWRAL